jgi:hypothetical protein
MDRFYVQRDAKDGVIFTGKSDDPIDPAKDNYEPGLYEFVDLAQLDDTFDRD